MIILKTLYIPTILKYIMYIIINNYKHGEKNIKSHGSNSKYLKISTWK